MTSSSSDLKSVDILCQEWHGDSYDGHVILLKEDGTGEITSRAELNLFLVAHLTWRFVRSNEVKDSGPLVLEKSLFEKLLEKENTVKILDATIEITITKSREPSSLINVAPDQIATLGGYSLLETAFQPRQFHVVIECGRFKYPDNTSESRFPSPVFGLRMTFDPSPYPPAELWKPEHADMLDSMRQFEKVYFVAQSLEETKKGDCISM